MSHTHLSLCFASLLTLLGIAVVEAALPPKFYQQAREQATHHVQVKVIGVAPPLKTPGECGVTGDVIRIFRDRPATLKPGTRLAFTVSCARRGDPPIVGGTLWTDYDELINAKYLEVFLNQNDGRYEVALWQSRIIEGPTPEPAFGSPAR